MIENPRRPEPYQLFEYYVFSPSIVPGLEDLNLKLLAIHAYALDILDKVEEFKIYLEAILAGLKDVKMAL